MEDHDLWYAALSWPQVQALIGASRATVLLLPLGATEPHGPHAPLSTDMIISVGMCRRAAGRLRDDPELQALILPPVSLGVTRYGGGFPGAVSISEATLAAIIQEICTGLIAQGLSQIMLVNNHFEPEHVRTIHRAIDTVRGQTGVQVGYLDLTRKERAQALTEEFQRLGSHAGRYETSLVLVDEPSLVDLAVMQGLPDVPVNMAAAIAAGVKDFQAMGLTEAYNGAPALASADEGEATFEHLTTMLIDQMRALVRGTGGRDGPGLFARV